MSQEAQPRPWSLKPRPLGLRRMAAVGAGSLIAAVYIGTGDISIATTMGAKFGYSLWWTYFALAVAGWALIDMSVRYFLRFGRTPMSIFKDIHPVLTVFMFVTVVVCASFGAYGQWNACAMVISGIFPQVPLEAGGTLAAVVGVAFIYQGLFGRLEKGLTVALLLLIAAFFASAFAIGIDWKAAGRGLVPNAPGEGWRGLFASNAGSMINAWLILIYPYTMMEKGWYSDKLGEKVTILHRVRIDYAWGIVAAGVVALPIMATAAAIAGPYGFVPKSYTDLSVLLAPLAGGWATVVFLAGLFLAAWASGVGWWLGGAYALLDVYNLPIKMGSKPMKVAVALFFVPSVALLFLRINPVFQIVVFAAFLAMVFPAAGLALLWRVSRKDMGYFGYNARSVQGVVLIGADLFAIAMSMWVGWAQIAKIIQGLDKLMG